MMAFKVGYEKEMVLVIVGKASSTFRICIAHLIVAHVSMIRLLEEGCANENSDSKVLVEACGVVINLAHREDFAQLLLERGVLKMFVPYLLQYA